MVVKVVTVVSVSQPTWTAEALDIQSQTGAKASKRSSTMDTVTLGVLVAVLVVILAALMYAKQVS